MKGKAANSAHGGLSGVCVHVCVCVCVCTCVCACVRKALEKQQALETHLSKIIFLSEGVTGRMILDKNTQSQGLLSSQD